MHSLTKGARICSSFQRLLSGIRSRTYRQVDEKPFGHHHRQLVCTAGEVDDHYPLTYREAVSYVEDVLLIPNCQKLAEVDPLSFLDTLTLQTKYRIPFTVLPFFSRRGRHLPSLEECKESMFTRQGGNCTLINTFTQAVLKQLGLEAYCFPTSAYRLGGSHLITHVGIIVKNLTQPGSLHLYDPGNRMPTFKTIPLDFESSSPTYIRYQQHLKYFKASLGAVNFCRKVDLTYLREQKTPALFHFDEGHFWEELFIYNIHEPRGLTYFSDVLQKLGENVVITKQIESGAIFVFGFPDGLLVDVNLKRCLTIDENGVKKITKINNIADLVENVRKFFPQLSVDKVASVAEILQICSHNQNPSV